MSRRRLAVLFGMVAVALGALWAGAAAYYARPIDATVTVFKSPDCACCGEWVAHLRAHGFDGAVREQRDLSPVRARLSVPADLESCHTAEVSGYTIEGHVPAADIRRLLRGRVTTRGLAVPGMPIGAPGMEVGGRTEPFEVISFADDGGRAVFSRY
ncbi:MAG: DUF411 domain-containing protein [Alphaproteobacteria bacterium]|nr:DUF411 domain-containing protein [Alphaproteobacteria bacterium]